MGVVCLVAISWGDGRFTTIEIDLSGLKIDWRKRDLVKSRNQQFQLKLPKIKMLTRELRASNARTV